MSPVGPTSPKLDHDVVGECEFVRVEGVDWILRAIRTGTFYRVHPSRRAEFVPLDSPVDSAVASRPSNAVQPTDSSAGSSFSTDGMKRLLWAIREGNAPSSNNTPAGLQSPVGHTSAVADSADGASTGSAMSDGDGPLRGSDTPQLPDSPKFVEMTGNATGETAAKVHPTSSVDPRLLRRHFESLRNGLSPVHVELRKFAVGVERIQRHVENLLADVKSDGGQAAVIRGGYGQGKTFSLQLLREMALEAGYMVASAEIDSDESKLDKPNHVYRGLLQHLQFPGGGAQGAHGLAVRTHDLFRREFASKSSTSARVVAVRTHLKKELQCEPLAWLLSDPTLPNKDLLVRLLGAEPGIPMAVARKSHEWPGEPRDWPAFTAGTQGDFASYVLAGIGRLSRVLGFQGLIVIIDEMEKWQDLDWTAQSRAGNLLGGLIWGATAEEGRRGCRRALGRCEHPDLLNHSMRCGGYPFSTASRCFLGLAIAMTPRGDDGPEAQWSDYGRLEIVDLPVFDSGSLEQYCRKVFPYYQAAYGIEGPMPQKLLQNSIRRWRARGDISTRTGVQSVVESLDDWRQSRNM